MTQHLTIHHPDAVDDPYPIESDSELRDAIRQEAEIVASDAGSDLLESPDQDHRDQLRDRIERDAYAALTGSGSYHDPAGIRWTLAAAPRNSVSSEARRMRERRR